MQPLDPEVFDDEVTGEEMDREAADMDRTVDLGRSGALGLLAQRRTEIDGQRRHERGRENRRDHREADAKVSQKAMVADSGEGIH